MILNRATLGSLALVGVVATGTGAYLANRHADVPAPIALNSTGAPAAAGSVNETEAAVQAAPLGTPLTAEKDKDIALANPAPPPAAPPAVRRQPPAERARTAAPAPARRREPSAPATSSPAASATSESAANTAVQPYSSTPVERAPIVPEPPQKQYEELVIPANSVIGLLIDNGVSSDRAKVEDSVNARVARDVKVRDYVAIPAGARAEGSVTMVDQGGRLKDQARLGIRFHTIVLADGTRMPINTETIYRDGASPAKGSAAKIGGGAVGGAVMGAIFGGKKGALIGSTIGAGAGGAAVASSEPDPATLPAGSNVTVRTSSPATVTIEK